MMTGFPQQGLGAGQHRRRRFLPPHCGLMLLLLAVVLPLTGQAAERVAGRRTGANQRSWRYGFEVARSPAAIRLAVPVHLIGSGGVNSGALRRYQTDWQAAVAKIWSNRCAVQDGTGALTPITVALRFTARDPEHTIVVRPGRGRADALHWHLLDDPRTIAHEVGHLLGAYDDYRGGGQDPERPVIDSESVMSARPGKALVQPRHFTALGEWLRSRDGRPGVRIVRLDAGARRVSLAAESS